MPLPCAGVAASTWPGPTPSAALVLTPYACVGVWMRVSVWMRVGVGVPMFPVRRVLARHHTTHAARIAAAPARPYPAPPPPRYREKDCPYGVVGWQGVVPARHVTSSNTQNTLATLHSGGWPHNSRCCALQLRRAIHRARARVGGGGGCVVSSGEAKCTESKTNAACRLPRAGVVLVLRAGRRRWRHA